MDTYEKKYKETLERAKQLLRTSVAFDRFTIERIFPELKESEDERIRKAILALVRQSSEVLDKQNQNNMIAWLEKQVEQKSAWSEEDEQIILSIEQAMNCASLLNIVPEKMDKIRTWLKSLKDRVGCEANCTTTKEWNESDKEEFQIAIDTLVEAGQHDSADWLKSLKQRIGE